MSTTLIIAILVGAAVGGVIGWLLAARNAPTDSRALDAEARAKALQEQVESERRRAESTNQKLIVAESERAGAAARAKAAEENLAEQKALLDSAEIKLREAFSKAANDALATSNQSFLDLAETRFKNLQQSAASDLDARKTSIDALVAPIRESLDKLQKESATLEQTRREDVGALRQQLETLVTSENALRAETNRLTMALKSPKSRGRWGEIALQNTVELAGMTEYCDFETQTTVGAAGEAQRPDLAVRLPGGQRIVVDAKVPFDAYHAATEATTEEERNAHLVRHAAQTRDHVKALAGKEYWKQFDRTPEFVVMFIPNDSFLAAAAEQDPGLIESAIQSKVLITTPTTLVALLKAIAFGWRQSKMQENAEQVQKLGQELSDRIATMVEHFARVGASLDNAVEYFNDAVGSFQSRVIPKAKEFEKLGAGGKKEVQELKAVETRTRALNPPTE